MVSLRISGSFLALAMIFMHVGAATASDAEPNGAWSERVQILYQSDTRSVFRKKIKVWNPEPQKNLDFVWEPAANSPADAIAADGTVNGEGKLVWRVRGSASYDPRTIYSVYTGTMKNGRPEGQGRLELRAGQTFEGTWKNGLLNGQGVHVDTAGNRWEGNFVDGVLNGEGRQRTATGEIFSGTFVDGLRQGIGKTRLSGGTEYESKWSMGKEIGGNRPDALADATVGGLLKAQSGGGDAGKLEIGVTVEERMNQQSEMKYQHLVRDEDIAIYPLGDDINNFWNGTAEINTGSYTFDGIDWATSPAFVEVGLNTSDGSKVKIGKLELDVAGTEIYRKPMLTLLGHVGCVGFRPSFSILNHGWGEVRDAKLSVQFAGETDYENPDKEVPTSRAFTHAIDNFDQGIDVNIEDVLKEAGVDTAKLETKRYNCQSVDSMNVCRSQVFNDVGFGEIADYVWGEDKLFTTAVGKIDYNWADDSGNVFAQSEPFRVDIALATIEVPKETAECGDGFGGSPEALRYQNVQLQLGQHDYVVDLPMRGNKNISNYVARLKMSAEKSSYTQFKVAAKLADGSVRESKTVSLFYFRPRAPEFQSAAQPASCYLPDEAGGC